MTWVGGLIIGLVVGCLVGEFSVLAAAATLTWVAEARDGALSDGTDA